MDCECCQGRSRVRPKDRDLALVLEERFCSFDRENRPLPGILAAPIRESLIEQILESVHRVQYVSVIRTRDISDRRADPNDEHFDPLKAAILYQRRGCIDEAFWMVFLFVHFGLHARAGWRYAREVYGRLGGPSLWDWANTSADPSGFRAWLNDNQGELKREGVPGGFGNHRKYQSFDAYKANGTGDAVESYVRWIAPPRTHAALMEQECRRADGDPRKAFDSLYRSMNTVVSFGRVARFDYLTMVGKLGLVPIVPGSPYMQGATGPIKGARLLFGVHETASRLDQWLIELDQQLNVGMQVLEDALCNWEKSPEKFLPFRG